MEQQRPWLLRAESSRAQGDEVVVVGGREGVDRFAGGDGLAAEGFGFAILFGVEDEDAAGEGGDAGVAAGSGGRGGAADAVGEGGEEQQRAGVKGRCMRLLARQRAGRTMTGQAVARDVWRRACSG